MYGKLRRLRKPGQDVPGTTPDGTPAAAGTGSTGPKGRGPRGADHKHKNTHNLFEAAAVYVAASAEDEQERMDEATGWVAPEALSFGVTELASRAVIALARERGVPPETVARALLGLPAA